MPSSQTTSDDKTFSISLHGRKWCFTSPGDSHCFTEFHPSVESFRPVFQQCSKDHLQDLERGLLDEQKKVWCMRSIAKIMCVLLGTLMRFFMIKMLKFQLKDPRWPNWPGQLADRHETSA